MSTQPADDFTAATSDDILRVEHISKRYGAVTALVDVSLRLERGEVLGLIGDNGAGKSTLIKILCGFQQPTSGRIILNGEQVTFTSVTQARSAGIDVVYQDLALDQPAHRVPQHVPQPGAGPLAAAAQQGHAHSRPRSTWTPWGSRP